MAQNYVKNANQKRTAEVGTQRILANLKRGYKNAAHENGIRKMLDHYLKGGV